MSEVVVDASVMVEALTDGCLVALLIHSHAPAHLRVEAASALRAMQRRGRLDKHAAATAFTDLQQVPLRTWDLEPLLPTAWDLRDEFTLFDGLYVALSMHLDAPLATLDRRLARSAARHCAVHEVN